jgi:iron complex transport system ATP-binding protein
MTEITVASVSVVHRGRAVLERICLTLTSEQPTIIVGPNGAGKSTLLGCILGLITPKSGTVTIDGQQIRRLSPRARAAAIAWLPQRARFDEPLSVGQYVATARYRFGESPVQSRKAVLRCLGHVGAEGLIERNVMTLSGGERQRIEFAALIAQEARVLLLDEPGNHLDPAQQAQSHQCLERLLDDGAAMVMVTHDLNLLLHLRTPRPLRVLGLSEGKIAFDVPLVSPELGDKLSELYGVPMQAIQADGYRFFVAVPQPVSRVEAD